MIIDEEIGRAPAPVMLGSKGPMVKCPDGVYRLQADCPPVVFGQRPPVVFGQRQVEDATRSLSRRLADLPPAASMVVPGAVTLLVDRKKHPILWTVFGAIPLGFATVRAISTGRLF